MKIIAYILSACFLVIAIGEKGSGGTEYIEWAQCGLLMGIWGELQS